MADHRTIERLRERIARLEETERELLEFQKIERPVPDDRVPTSKQIEDTQYELGLLRRRLQQELDSTL